MVEKQSSYSPIIFIFFYNTYIHIITYPLITTFSPHLHNRTYASRSPNLCYPTHTVTANHHRHRGIKTRALLRARVCGQTKQPPPPPLRHQVEGARGRRRKEGRGQDQEQAWWLKMNHPSRYTCLSYILAAFYHHLLSLLTFS